MRSPIPYVGERLSACLRIDDLCALLLVGGEPLRGGLLGHAEGLVDLIPIVSREHQASRFGRNRGGEEDPGFMEETANDLEAIDDQLRRRLALAGPGSGIAVKKGHDAYDVVFVS